MSWGWSWQENYLAGRGPKETMAQGLLLCYSVLPLNLGFIALILLEA